MKREHQDLLDRLEKFTLDQAAAALPFTERLAREQGWSQAFTQRVIREYKRFAFLAVAAGHPVSPSPSVDEAWHLHLLYTQSYWADFCGRTLGTPLHHQPTRGGPDEKTKFADWYAQTLASYEVFFGECPPTDIWPVQPQHSLKQTFDPTTHWLMPKPRWLQDVARARPGAGRRLGNFLELFLGWLPWVRRRAAALWLTLLVALFVVGCSWRGTPFDWRGPDFLNFFFQCVAASFLSAIALRYALRGPGGVPSVDPAALDPYAATYLAGGKRQTFNAALANLLHRKVVELNPTSGQLAPTSLPPQGLHPVEEELYQAITLQPVTVRQVRQQVPEIGGAHAAELQGLGFLLSRGQKVTAVLVPLLVALVPVALGAIKVGIGLHRHRPVEILVVGCGFVTVAALAGFARTVLRTRRGDSALAQLRAHHAPLRQGVRQAFGSLSPVALPLAVGLFGLSILDGTPLEAVKKKINPPGSGSSCGTSGCGGGGSSCGGGGDGGGGGGCGGCGGGGD